MFEKPLQVQQHRVWLGKTFWLRLPHYLVTSQTGVILNNLVYVFNANNSTWRRDHFRGTWFIESLSKVNKMRLISFIELLSLTLCFDFSQPAKKTNFQYFEEQKEFQWFIISSCMTRWSWIMPRTPRFEICWTW